MLHFCSYTHNMQHIDKIHLFFLITFCLKSAFFDSLLTVMFMPDCSLFASHLHVTCWQISPTSCHLSPWVWAPGDLLLGTESARSDGLPLPRSGCEESIASILVILPASSHLVPPMKYISLFWAVSRKRSPRSKKWMGLLGTVSLSPTTCEELYPMSLDPTPVKPWDETTASALTAAVGDLKPEGSAMPHPDSWLRGSVRE